MAARKRSVDGVESEGQGNSGDDYASYSGRVSFFLSMASSGGHADPAL